MTGGMSRDVEFGCRPRPTAAAELLARPPAQKCNRLIGDGRRRLANVGYR